MSDKSTSFSKIQCGDLVLDLETPQIMGIVNLTEDSFFDGGHYLKGEQYLSRAATLIEGGAAIIDIGAASSRPGTHLIDEQEEWQVLETPIKRIRSEFPDVLVSVDTYNAGQVRKCADLGVHIMNDISGGSWDADMYTQISKFKMAYVMMHIQGKPKNMQDNPQYISVIEEVKRFFEEGIKKLNDLNFSQIIIDPGFGFGKSIEHNYQLLAKLNDLRTMGYPVLAGLSRKSMIFKPLEISPQEALNGSTALHMLALQNGAQLLRVHDAREANETIRLFSKYKEALEMINK